MKTSRKNRLFRRTLSIALMMAVCSPTVLADEALSIRKTIPASQLWQAPSQVTFKLYDSPHAEIPLVSQSFDAGRWISNDDFVAGKAMRISAQLPNTGDIDTSQKLWLETVVDGSPVGPREAFPAAIGTLDISVENYIESRSGGLIFPDGSTQSTAGITAVTAGTGLSGGGDSGDVTLSADTTYLQRRVSASCTAGNSIRAIAADGTVTCETDDNSGGDITAVIAGVGLHGGAHSGDATLNVNMPLVLSGSVGSYAGVLQGSNSNTHGLGIQGSGVFAGGHFEDANDSGYSFIGKGDYGIQGFGNFVGGYFKDLDSSGKAHVGFGDQGIAAYGNDTGGYFLDLNDGGRAYVGYGERGIEAYGKEAGGYFKDANSSGHAYVGYSDWGIQAFGKSGGGHFKDTNSSGWAYVGFSSYKIQGIGTVAFVQNHPENKDEVIVYNSPEGDEVATYTRGSARLVNGEARIPLGETFKWVTNPDIGLTAHLTPINGWAPLYVASKSTTELVVKSAPGYPDNVAFDYIVYGLRIGFEDITVVQRKTQEARIPSMAGHRKAIAEHPELAQYTALSRFARMQGSSREEVKAQMVNAAALLEKIEEFDPKIHKLDGPEKMQ